MIIHGDSLDELKSLESESVDLLCTDPPYGYSFMGKSWDKALPDIGIFKECFRVLKPGAFAFVMSAPRSDVCSRMAILLEDAGFNIAFTPIYWTYASGFPKAANIGKMVDKREGVEREVIGYQTLKGNGTQGTRQSIENTQGRFPANLLVEQDILNGHSRFFSLDEWAQTLPFLAVPKASKSEKNAGLHDRTPETVSDGREKTADNAFQRGATERLNIHPTVKPLKLMSYLITLGSRPGDTVLDPFLGSGTTAIAAKNLGRNYIGIEREEEYVEIARARLATVSDTLL